MFRNESIKLGLGIAGILLLSGCASFDKAAPGTPSPLGAWASGGEANACESMPITYFSSDGVVAVLLSANGPVHSIGSWSRSGDALTMTHNDFPLDPSGQSKPAVELNIVTLDADNFVTRNAKGDVRERIKCNSVTINTGHDDGSH